LQPDFPWDADMFSFNMALLSLDILHDQSTNLMISDPFAGTGTEGWGFLGLDSELQEPENLPGNPQRCKTSSIV
jgi:hypothetical protein